MNVFSGLLGCDRKYIWFFDFGDYVYFLDHVQSLGDLVLGLYELSPLADDALVVAETMTPADFSIFKVSLAQEREKRDNSVLSEREQIIILPWRFVHAALLAEKYQVPFGAALIRIMDLEGKVF